MRPYLVVSGSTLVVLSWVLIGRIFVSLNRRLNEIRERVSRLEGREDAGSDRET